MARMATLEEQVGALASSSCTKQDVRSRTGDLVRVYDALHQDLLEVRRKLWDVGELSGQAQEMILMKKH